MRVRYEVKVRYKVRFRYKVGFRCKAFVGSFSLNFGLTGHFKPKVCLLQMDGLISGRFNPLISTNRKFSKNEH